MAVKKRSPKQNSGSGKKAAKPTNKQDICFIIMPFGEWFDYYYKAIYVPAIESSGLTPRRADNLYRPSAIVNDIWALTQEAKIVLADLSGKNPNVFYELGLAHAVAKPAILVAESIDDVPFDLRALRVLIYDKNEPEWGRILQESIKTAIREVLDAPLEAVLPTFINVKDSTKKTTISKEEKVLISMRRDIDSLKRTVQAKSMNQQFILPTSPLSFEPISIHQSPMFSVIDDDIVHSSNLRRSARRTLSYNGGSLRSLKIPRRASENPPNNGMHPTADTLLVIYFQRRGAAGDAGR